MSERCEQTSERTSEWPNTLRAQRHLVVSGTLALPKAVVLKLDVGRVADPIGNDVL